MPDLTYRDAINLALAEETRRDLTVLLMGEDVAAPGAIFKITQGLLGEKGPVWEGDAGLAALDGPAVVRPGDAATIVATLAMVPRVRAAADILAEAGVEAEVIDFTVLRPLNVAPIVERLARTGRLVAVEEQHRLGGWGGQVIAEVVEHAPGVLEAPPRRVALPEHPLPFSPPLEDAALPSAERIAEAVRDIL